MPRKPRAESPTGVYHLMARGVNKRRIFHSRRDYEAYFGLVSEYCKKLNVEIYHYCILPNHIHFVLRSNDLQTLSRFGYITHRRYAYYYCKTHPWSEQVFRRHFLSKPIVDDAYLLECGRYVERNPIDAGLTVRPEDYPYSSYSFYAQGEPNALLTESPLYPTLGKTPAERMAAYRMYVCHERRRDAEKLTVPF
jgi:putative transposase